jgi:hypothetical protein
MITAAGLTSPSRTKLLLKENEEIISILITIVKKTPTKLLGEKKK